MSDGEKVAAAAAPKDLEKMEESKEAEDGSDSKANERPGSGGRKSLEGLSPSQDAKVGTLKQMFQDYDYEVLCSVLFEQSSGDLDKSIETILKMQKVLTGSTDADNTPQASSLVDTDEPSNDKEKTGDSAANVDKQTQELIDEMIAEDEQAMMEAEQEAEEELARQQHELRLME